MTEIDNKLPPTTDPASPDGPSQFSDVQPPTPQDIVKEAVEHNGTDRLAVLSEVAMQTADMTFRQRLAALDALEPTGVSPEEIRALKSDLVRQEVSRQAGRASLHKRVRAHII